MVARESVISKIAVRILHTESRVDKRFRYAEIQAHLTHTIMFTQQQCEEKQQSLRDQYIGRRVILTCLPDYIRDMVQPNTGELTALIFQGIRLQSYEEVKTVKDVGELTFIGEDYQFGMLYFTDGSKHSMDLLRPFAVH